MLRKDRDLGLKQRLTNKPWKHSGYEVTIIPFLYKNAKCTWWEKSELQAGGISLQCVLWPMAGAQEVVINDSPGHYWTQRRWGRESHVDMRWRFGNKNPIRNDSPILDSVKNEFIFLNISGLVAEFVFLSPSLFFFLLKYFAFTRDTHASLEKSVFVSSSDKKWGWNKRFVGVSVAWWGSALLHRGLESPGTQA